MPENVRHPLYDWGITEAQALQYCYDHGFDWDGLYEYFDRVSCWLCPLQGIKELRTLRKVFPELWSKLRVMDALTYYQYRADYSIEQLERRFALEDAQGCLWGDDVNGQSWQPKVGDVYYRPRDYHTAFSEAVTDFWRGTVNDFALKEAGMIFRTEEECEAALPALQKKRKRVVAYRL